MKPHLFWLVTINFVLFVRLLLAQRIHSHVHDEIPENSPVSPTIPTTGSTTPTTTQTTTFPLPTRGPIYAFMTYADFMLASIVNGTWPEELPYVPCSEPKYCLPTETCLTSLGCSRGVCADLSLPEFSAPADLDSSQSPSLLDSSYHFIRKRSRSFFRPPAVKTYYGNKCVSGDDCATIGRRPDGSDGGGIPCISNGTDELSYYCICPPKTFFYRESYCKLFDYGDLCKTDFQCNSLFVMQNRLVCREGRCVCADDYQAVTVWVLRGAWGIRSLPPSHWPLYEPIDNTYCLPSRFGAFIDNVPVGSNCTLDVLGSPSPRICAEGLVCLYCAGDTHEGTCVEYPLKLPTTTPPVTSCCSKTNYSATILILLAAAAAIFHHLLLRTKIHHNPLRWR